MFVPRPGLLPQRSIVHCSAFASVIECLKVYGDKLGHQFDDFVSHHVSFLFFLILLLLLCIKQGTANILTRKSTTFPHLVSTKKEDFSIADGQDILKHAGYCMDVIEACTVCEEDALNSINLCRQSLSSVFGSLISRCHSLARHDRSEISMSGKPVRSRVGLIMGLIVSLLF
jgi:anthranilate/para-aminobenzoate synthase component II